MSSGVRILLISGSTRAASTNTAAVRAANDIDTERITTAVYDGLPDLPAFNPDDDADPLPSTVSELRAAIAAADGVLFCSPEYAGGLPGSFKNLLDWTVGGAEMYRKPVTWISVAPEGRGNHADAALRTVLGYVGATIIEPAGARVVVARADLDAEGRIASPDVRARLQEAVGAFADGVRVTRSDP
jgi:chromate reductase, NAD(P)H dehydrogenase (quinone)